MDFFTQLVYVIGRVTPSGVEMLGTGFLVSRDGVIATTHHVVGSSDANLVILAPHTNDLNAFQDLSDTSCRTIPVAIKEIDPIRDIALLKAEIRIDGQIPPLGSFDADSVGDEIGIFGFPHCVEGRRALTYQKRRSEPKSCSKLTASNRNMPSSTLNPGPANPAVSFFSKNSISGVLVGAWVPGLGGISLGGINPKELHQTTHCVSVEYVKDML